MLIWNFIIMEGRWETLIEFENFAEKST